MSADVPVQAAERRAVDDPNLHHLLGRVALVQDRIRGAVAHRRADDPSPDDPFRGLYLSDEVVDRLLGPDVAPPLPDTAATARLADLERWADGVERAGATLRLRRLERDFGLLPLDVELLLVALAPDLDSRFERLYGYLNDDVTRRRATVGLALELCGLPAASAAARARLGPGAPLVDADLVLVDDLDRPLLTRSLRVPDRVTGHLLGHDRPDPTVAALTLPPPIDPGADHDGLARSLAANTPLVYVREKAGGAGRAFATAALSAAGRPVLGLDLSRLGSAQELGPVAAVIGREARLQGAGIVAGPVEVLVERGPAAVRALAELPVPVVLVGRATWDPLWTDVVPLLVDAPLVTAAQRADLWAASLNGSADPDLDAGRVTAQFLLSPEQVSRAARSASLQARLAGTAISAAHLRLGARAQNDAGLERLARRIEPAVSWPDLVLPPTTLGQLRELAARARNRDRVLSEWGMRPGGGRGRGIAALFAGDSGTGKTMSAEIIAAELGLDMYTINLATVVDKYVGETEKNLERIFTEASGVNGVLLFDEADAIFGKRSEVKDAHDRYANIESAYLLQRMESFDGLAILATNLRANLDDAFTRRLDMVVDFPTPDEEHRLALWDRCLGTEMPRDEDLDLEFCARAFELAGGNIRSITLTAAYYAADADRPVAMADLIRATQAEYRKLGRLTLEREFGPYHSLLTR